jgi:hypothetical protein
MRGARGSVQRARSCRTAIRSSFGGSGDHDAIRDGVGREVERTLDVTGTERLVDGRNRVGINAECASDRQNASRCETPR